MTALSTSLAVDLGSWLTKEETAAALSVSTKSVERYQAEGQLTHAKRAQRGAPSKVVYNPGDVEVLRVKLAKPAVVLPPERDMKLTPPVFALPAAAPVDLAPVVSELRHFAEALVDNAKDRQERQQVYVSGKVAQQITGLSIATIREMVKREDVKTMPYGNGVRYRRADLEML